MFSILSINSLAHNYIPLLLNSSSGETRGTCSGTPAIVTAEAPLAGRYTLWRDCERTIEYSLVTSVPEQLWAPGHYQSTMYHPMVSLLVFSSRMKGSATPDY